MKLLMISLLFLLASCTTVEFVRKDTSPEKKAVLRHSPTSDAAKQAKYKTEIDKKAKEFCKGDYTITKEYEALDQADSSVGVGTGFGIGGGGSSFILGSSNPSRSMAQFTELTCVQ